MGYNPDEPRDSDGKWSGGGGGGGEGHTDHANLVPLPIPMSSHQNADLKHQYIETLVTGAKPVVKSVPISSLRSTQAMVNAAGGSSGSDPIKGIEDAAGHVHIINGHHRAADAINKGHSMVQVEVFPDHTNHADAVPKK